jgi:aquaporin Z
MNLIREFLCAFFLFIVGLFLMLFVTFLDYLCIGLIGSYIIIGIFSLVFLFGVDRFAVCHFHPAVSFSMLFSGRIHFKIAIRNIIAQLLGFLIASLLFFCIIIIPFNMVEFGFSNLLLFNNKTNVYYDLTVVFLFISFITFVFNLVILELTNNIIVFKVTNFFIGLTMLIVYLISLIFIINVMNIKTIIFSYSNIYLFITEQLILVFIAPVFGGIIAGFSYKVFLNK